MSPSLFLERITNVLSYFYSIRESTLFSVFVFQVKHDGEVMADFNPDDKTRLVFIYCEICTLFPKRSTV